MADATFDGSNLHIQIPSTGTFDAQKELYSAWKEWIKLSDNAKYPPAFDTTGGDDVGGGQEIAPYFFCRNDLGWRIKMPQADGEIVITGNLFARSPNVSLFEQTSGYDAFLRLEVSTRAVLVNGGGGSGSGGATAQEIWEYSGTRSLTDQLAAGDVRTQVDNALTAYDGPTKAELDSAQSTLQAYLILLQKYHDNKVRFFASDGVTEVTQQSAFQMVVYDDDETTPLKIIGFRNAANQATSIGSATQYVKLL